MSPIGIVAYGACSALGTSAAEVWENYQKTHSHIHFSETKKAYECALSPTQNNLIQTLQSEQKYYDKVDKTVLLSLLAARQAYANSGWNAEQQVAVNIGSSRGATELFEQYHQAFLENKNLKENQLASPMTTLGNISAWTAKDLNVDGLAFSHSLTCSTAFQSMLNAIAWLESGMAQRFMAGGSEAPLTPFTIAQMQALRIYSQEKTTDFPCRAMDLTKEKNTMVLGEGAAVFCLEKNPQKAVAWIRGIGFATEKTKHPISISTQGLALQQSMQQAIAGLSPEAVDVIITHTPGTIRGDQAEYNAIQTVFGKNMPLITNNKWKIGHTLGASGALSLEMAILMILHNQFIPIPYLADSKLESQKIPQQINTILINTIGFGGTAVSILISK